MIPTIIFIILGVVALLLILSVWGLRFRPQPFPAYPQTTSELETVSLPGDLPAPVERFYRRAIGEQIPIIHSAVLTTRGKLRFMGITFPHRFRFTHDAGQDYRHYIEAAFFGLPLMKVNEQYLDGRARMELPVGVIENEPKVDMAANLGLWGESIWLSPIFLTDSRVRWEAIDDTTAHLVVPFEDGEDRFTVFFDPESDLIERMEAMRYKEADSTQKTLWTLEPRGWAEFAGMLIPSPAAVTWGDEEKPWLVLEIEEVVYNVDITDYIRAKGI